MSHPEIPLKKYALLAYREERQWQALSDDERQAFERACLAAERDLAGSLHLLDVSRLQAATALTIRMVDGEVSVAAGPAPGELTQLLLVQARDLNAAIQIASKLPQARTGQIEVRSIEE